MTSGTDKKQDQRIKDLQKQVKELEAKDPATRTQEDNDNLSRMNYELTYGPDTDKWPEGAQYLVKNKPEPKPTPDPNPPSPTTAGQTKDGISLILLPAGYSYDLTNIDYKPNENFKPDGSYRLDFAGVKNQVVIGGYIQCDGSDNTEEISGKVGGGKHTGAVTDAIAKNARCYDLGINWAGTRARARKEFPHPSYHNIEPTNSINIGDVRKKFIGVQYIKYNQDNKVILQTWVDVSGLDANGKPTNNWQKVFEIIDDGNLNVNTKNLQGGATADDIKKPWLTTYNPSDGATTIRVDQQTPQSFKYKFCFCTEIKSA